MAVLRPSQIIRYVVSNIKNYTFLSVKFPRDCQCLRVRLLFISTKIINCPFILHITLSRVQGTQCKNSGCKTTFMGDHTNNETCYYHEGAPVFHEGMKYWSCCQRKTSDFAAFLDQEGCSSGKHVWFKQVNVSF